MMRTNGAPQRVRLRLAGAVQGVGFRPFVCRLAARLEVGGWVANDAGGVVIEAEADEAVLGSFVRVLLTEAPPAACVHDVSSEALSPLGARGFRILDSNGSGVKSAAMLPDFATCDACMAEVRAATDRRAGYAFTNCTDCGPRFSIIRALPYDRPATTMADFVMCGQCRSEYADPLDRRFHAQPNACPDCGPQLSLLDATGSRAACAEGPLVAAAGALAAGRIVAVKGIGGYHLMADARSEAAVAELRARKRRPTRPFAVMAASVAHARTFVDIDEAEALLLCSPATPILLLPRRRACNAVLPGAAPGVELAAGVAPGNPRLGVMLPSTPLHHLLLAAFGAPVIATSGNLSDEPICTGEAEAVARLAGIADMFLVHDRPIERHVDDSVAVFVAGAPRLLRRARGYAPAPVLLPAPVPPILAVGPHLKNTVALSSGRQVFISQHIGDLETMEAQLAFERVAADLLRLYEARPAAVARDLHPDYASTAWAAAFAREHHVTEIAVQHHHAHLVSCMADNGVTARTLGVTWDGTGYGSDGTSWGGEFLLGNALAFERVASLLPFRLPGGDAAAREPRRVAAALLHAALGPDALLASRHPALSAYTDAQRHTLLSMVDSGLNSPVTTSAGRLLDGIAALLGVCETTTFEGEAAMRLEYAVDPHEHGAYHVPATTDGDVTRSLIDWRPMIRELFADMRRGAPVAAMAARVHNALVDAILIQAEIADCHHVALSGGCFQNRVLTQRAADRLRKRGFAVLLHRQVPPNDGGIALGQVVVAAARLAAGVAATADDAAFATAAAAAFGMGA
jgi:hydrogenase maturation protein HypF